MATRSTQAYIQDQWNEIEKEIKKHTYDSLRQSITYIAQEVIQDYRDYTSYETRTGNMDASVMAGFFENGRLAQTVAYTDTKPKAYTKSHKSKISFLNRYGENVTYDAATGMTGDEVSWNFLKEYGILNRGSRRYELVVVGEMFYRYALEDRGYIQFFQHLENQYESNLEKWKKDFDLKRRIGVAMLKNVRLGK